MSHPNSGPRRVRRGLRWPVAAVATLALLSGCSLFGNGGTGSDPQDPSGGDQTTITIQTGNTPHIDPQVIVNGMWLDSQGLLEGLVIQNKEGTDVRPGAADKWEVSEDGLTYTFHLREGGKWSNGEPVTSADALFSYERLMDSKRGSGGVTMGATSFQATLGIKNAAAFNSGEITDFSQVGIKAPDEKTIEFTLEKANPGFLMGMTHPSMLLLNEKAVSDESKDWQQPANFVGSGPYKMTAWQPNASMVWEKNPEYWDAESVGIDKINIQLIEGGAVTTTVDFENGKVDIQGLPTAADLARFEKDPNLKDSIVTKENVTTMYLARLQSKNKALQDPKVLKALSLALGREEVAATSRTNAGGTLVSPNTPGWNESVQATPDLMDREASVAEAKKLLEEAGHPNGEGLPTITLLAGVDTPNLDVIADTWQKNLGVKVKKDIVESGVYVERRYQLHDEDYAGFWYGTFSALTTWPSQTEALWGKTMFGQIALDDVSYAEYDKISKDKSMDAGKKNAAMNKILEEKGPEKFQEYLTNVDKAREATEPADQEAAYQAAAKAREEAFVLVPVAWQPVTLVKQDRIQGLQLRASADRYYFKDLTVQN
ncbi:peptide ABC transporter substrate-binding protein [Propionibacteriaceae bacterium Y1685]|uniref:peptide ABC transporter substrate-binding protein n=1 Tax=Microlunatus sp. Y1700 TaxID=3418487 RepID=UPI003B7BF3E4